MTIRDRVRVLAAVVWVLPGCGDDTVDTTESSAAETSSGDLGSSAGEPTPTSSGGFELLCTPGEERCADETTREVCAPTGLSWKPSACGAHQTCTHAGGDAVATCVGPCEVNDATPSSLGCDFVALRVRSSNGGEDPSVVYDALVVGNPGEEDVAVQLYFAEDGSHQEQAMGEPVVLAKRAAHVFQLTSDTINGPATIRSGGIYRVRSDLPVVAYLHSPLKNSDSNDSSLLLPVQALRQDYVVASYPGYATDPKQSGGRPSYFNVVSLANDTNISWVPKRDSAGNGITPLVVKAGEQGAVQLNKLDVLQLGAHMAVDDDQFALQDISGTVIHADKPVWVLGGTSCARVPFDSPGFCNHLQEQMIPVEYWGKRYYAAHSPLRGQEKHYWRVYAGEDGITVTTNPSQPPGSKTLARKGDYWDLVVASGESFVFQGTGAFMPVQYLASASEAAKIGDPAMLQTIPFEQHLTRYVFVTGIGFPLNYAQVVREPDGADVFINGEKVEGYSFINGGFYEENGVKIQLAFDTADVLLDAGEEARVFVVESEAPFGVSVIGYSSGAGGNSAYAYPGGLGLKDLGER